MSSFFLINIMFQWFVRQYPKASDINENTTRQTAYKFLSYAPRKELEKLDLSQIKFLQKIGRHMPFLDSWARQTETALYLLVIRKEQILHQEEMRKNGIEPEPKKEEEEKFLDRLTSKLASLFNSSRKNKYSLIDDNIQAPLRQLPQ